MLGKKNHLSLLRAYARMTQAEFAEAMGVPLRTYENLESERTPIREVHIQAARMALIQLAVEDPEGGYIPMPLEEFIKALHVQHLKDSIAAQET